MSEPIIFCPNCKTEIKLTKSLAAPLLESTRKSFEHQLAIKDEEILSREESIHERERQVLQSQKNIQSQIDAKVQEQNLKDRALIIQEETAKARNNAAQELELKSRELEELQHILLHKDLKLAEAQKLQAAMLKKERELDDAKREMDLTIERRVQNELVMTRSQARKEVEDEQKLKLMEREHTISAMQKQIEDLKRRAEQGSQQLQGEVLELELESLLRAKFPYDQIEPVGKGEFGGDVIHKVFSTNAQHVGTILWESKRTRNWSDAWLTKLREDQRQAKAEIAVIVSQVLPKDIESFDLVDGVWVTNSFNAIPVGFVLRQTLLEVATARQSSEGQQSKTEMVYQYLTGPRFKLRVGAIVEAFTTMKEDLDKERKVIIRQWAKREEQIDKVMQSTIGMYGDLQGIAGKSLQQIEGLEFTSLIESEE